MRKRDMDFNNLIVDIETIDGQNLQGMHATVESLSELEYAVTWTPEGAEDDTVPAIAIPNSRIKSIKIWPNVELDEADEAAEAARIAEELGERVGEHEGLYEED